MRDARDGEKMLKKKSIMFYGHFLPILMLFGRDWNGFANRSRNIVGVHLDILWPTGEFSEQNFDSRFWSVFHDNLLYR